MAIKNKTMHNITGYSKIVKLGMVLLLATTLIFPIHLFDFGNHINPGSRIFQQIFTFPKI